MTTLVEDTLKEVARSLVPYGGRAGSVYQAMLDLGHLVSLEDCQAAVNEVLNQLK